MVKPVDDDAFITIIWSSLSIGTFILLLILILSIKNFFCKSSTKTKHATKKICNDRISMESVLKYLQIFHVSGYILCNISWILYWHILLNVTTLTSDQRLDYLIYTNAAATMSFAFGSLSFFSLLIFRLYSVFYQTEYQLPTYALVIWSFLLLLIFITYCLFIVDAFGDLDDDTFNNIVFPSLVILNMITGLSLIYAFGAKLWRLAMKMSINSMSEYKRYLTTTTAAKSTTFTYSRSNTKSLRTPTLSARTTMMDDSYQWVEYEVELDQKQIQLLKVIVKNALLGWISILVIQIYFIFQWVELNKRTHFGWDVWSWYLCTRWILRTVVMSVEIFCVYLSFSVNKKLFGCLCGKCAKYLQICCQLRMRKKMGSQRENEMSLLGAESY